MLEKSFCSEGLPDTLVFFVFQSGNPFRSAGAYFRCGGERQMPACFLNFSVISRNTLIAGASAARKVVVFEVSARCSRVSSELGFERFSECFWMFVEGLGESRGSFRRFFVKGREAQRLRNFPNH